MNKGEALLTFVAVVTLVGSGAGLAWAQAPGLTNAQIRAQEIRNAAIERSTELRTTSQARLDEARLRACQNREAAIQRIVTRMAARAERHLGVFDTIAERVINFYTERGRVLDNYDVLVAEVGATRVIAAAAIDALMMFEDFDCEGDAPKEAIQAFRQAHQDLLGALQDYRTAIKDLIVGVKSIQGQESSNQNANTSETESETEEEL